MALATWLPQAPSATGPARWTTSVRCLVMARRVFGVGRPTRKVGYRGKGTDGTRSTG